MLDGPSMVAALKRCGVTHVVWLPDSELGTWDAALSGPGGLPLVRVCREGEAFAVAAGLHLGGQRPIILIQCTGLFEAGDVLRNTLLDLKLPLFFVVGVRSALAHRSGKTWDTCPVYTEPILKAWGVSYVWLDPNAGAEALAEAYLQSQADGRPGAALLPE